MDAFQQELISILPRLRRLARTLTRSVADADDLVQIALERALSRRAQWAAGTRLDCWVMRIMKNAWIDQIRQSKRQSAILGAAEDGETVADPHVATASDRIDAMAISQAMNALPDEQRIAVSLVLIEGLSYAEAAEVLEIPPGTLTSRLVRGRAALMSRLEMDGVRP